MRKILLLTIFGILIIGSMGIVKSLGTIINSPYEGQIFILYSNSPGLYIDINVSTDEEAKCKVYPGMCSPPNEGIGVCLYPNPVDISSIPSKNHFKQVFYVNNQNYMFHTADVECIDNSSQTSHQRILFSFQYETCTSNLINSTWSDWTNISCLSIGIMNQSRSLVQYDSNNCGSTLNKTIYEYRAILSCGTPNLPTYFLSLHDPAPGIYHDRRLNLDLNSNTVFSKIDFIDYFDTRPRWISLCRNCDSYNRVRSFSDGGHNITFIGVLSNGQNVTNSTDFFVDSKDPQISTTKPSRRNSFTNGSNFIVEYDEDNVKYVGLFWNPNVTREDCPSGRNQECGFNINLNNFNGQEIEYWFEVEDIAGNRKVSRKTKVKVDTISPIINSFDYVVRGRNVDFRIEINEQNFDSVEYIDYNERRPRWGALCSRLREGVCSVRKSFGSGEHNLKIKVLDKAGNGVEREIGFRI